MPHVPVLSKEVIQLLDVQPSDVVVDGTMNGGGHARSVLERLGDDGAYVGIEWDPTILRDTEQAIRSEYAGRLPERSSFVHGNYRHMRELMRERGFLSADAILLDIGFSSLQMDDPMRGFSIQHDGPLDMRYDATAGHPAHALVNSSPEKELADLIYAYGEERKSRAIAKAIVEARRNERIMTTGALKRVVESAVGKKPWLRVHPATKTFQALRIAVNDELGNLRGFLESLPDILAPRGRCAIISFHSLEDRIIKNIFRDFKNRGIADLLTKKPIIPGRAETQENPRSRSAKMRVLQKN